jgi:hypothetical protein
MKYKKALADYKTIYNQEEKGTIDVNYEDYLAELEYLSEISNCSLADIKLVHVRAIGEIVIYIDDKFYGYMDNALTNKMDRYNNEKL